MTESNILNILKNIKIKHCEGCDRIPLRVLNEGAELLAKPLNVILSEHNKPLKHNFYKLPVQIFDFDEKVEIGQLQI